MLQIMAKVTCLIWGDSHIRRLAEAESVGNYISRTTNLDVSFKHRGGATVGFLRGYPEQPVDIILVALGSNDLANGVSPRIVLDMILTQSRRLIAQGSAKRVVIMNIWPRAHRVYNAKAWVFNQLAKEHCCDKHATIVFWELSSRMKYACGRDRVHLVPTCYSRALKSFTSCMLWYANHGQ